MIVNNNQDAYASISTPSEASILSRQPTSAASTSAQRPSTSSAAASTKERSDRANREAHLTLVGAGPGDPDLITLKAIKALRTADVVLYDALSSDELLEETPANCRRVFVGKRAGCHYKKQEQINQLIVDCAREYGHVVRLKGGDPFVFGRGQEEIAFAHQHNIPTTIVPGISSCISLPELQGVAPTSRGYADSFWVMTAHTRDHGISEDLLLAPKTQATIIILMGMSRLDQICALWDAEGKGNLPAMVIQNGSLPNEKCWVGTVNNIAQRVAAERNSGPGIIVLGETVSQHTGFLRSVNQRVLAVVENT